ncbi:putative transcription factor Hap3/NF-YB family [Medicago truncatula]|uniref:Nuclear transcription factor Y protein n=1 Tax=Medicago truncatula TaxID=3880 RepID=I3TAW4_MEDTR|nr:nuclear transcription factor Y subunit B-4 [Medicago truncatula]AFK49656.1 nuclear transcription factor Y subunit B6 [Medicago truncatula]KEH43233.1 nuclear transcription factor Y protein [Medicago truncatula]RHN81144.1 putative transcription factor Hap3/NF-YB family [Medicago truncatula]
MGDNNKGKQVSDREVFKYNTNFTSHEQEQDHEVIKEQDRLLPIANVGRIMKQILPPNAKISKDAKETMQECVSEFVSFVTGEASDKCHKEKRKTVNGDDVCWALGTLGFDDYAEPLKRYLYKYRELDAERGNQNNKGNNNINININNNNSDEIENNINETYYYDDGKSQTPRKVNVASSSMFNNRNSGPQSRGY